MANLAQFIQMMGVLITGNTKSKPANAIANYPNLDISKISGKREINWELSANENHPNSNNKNFLAKGIAGKCKLPKFGLSKKFQQQGNRLGIAGK